MSQRYRLDQVPEDMVIEPPLPDDPAPNDGLADAIADVDNMLPPVTDGSGRQIDPAAAFGESPVMRAEPVAPEFKGDKFDFSPFNAIADAIETGNMDAARKLKDQLTPVQQHVLERASMMEAYTPERAAADATAFMDLQAKQGQDQKDPAKRAEVATAQLALQDAYLQEMEYQSHLNTVNNPQASRAERQAAISAIDGLATAIGKRAMGSGAGSRDAMTAGKKAVGFIDWRQEYNPLADYTPQIDVMRRGSDNRLGAIRQQMEAAGVPVPEFKGAAATPRANPAQMVLERFGVKAPDGNPVMLNGSPVVSFKRGGKDVIMRQTPNGGFVELTAEEAAALRGQ